MEDIEGSIFCGVILAVCVDGGLVGDSVGEDVGNALALANELEGIIVRYLVLRSVGCCEGSLVINTVSLGAAVVGVWDGPFVVGSDVGNAVESLGVGEIVGP